MNQIDIDVLIDKASECIGTTWPLYSFVTSNPLSGYEKKQFYQATKKAKDIMGATVFPKVSVYRKALQNGDISISELNRSLRKKGYTASPDSYLDMMESQTSQEIENTNNTLDRYMAKWLSAFMDEGLAEWQMPFKSEGFYQAWKKLAPYDESLGNVRIKNIPNTSGEALEMVLNKSTEKEILDAFTVHLAALPGWIGYINHRTKSLPTWHKNAPIELKDYLAIRFWICKKMGLNIFESPKITNTESQITELQYLFLSAWEKSWQNQLVKTLKESSIKPNQSQSETTPDAQMVFCIDTRSELIRRHVENKGYYETFGYAGFFGIAMDYQNPKNGIAQKSCPPIVDSCYTVNEIPKKNKDAQKESLDRKNEVRTFWTYFLKRMKNMLPSTFGFVEGAGFYYGVNLFTRTLFSKTIYRWNHKQRNTYEETCEPSINTSIASEKQELAIPLAEKAAIVKSAFQLMGWKNFAPLVLFVGHGSHSANNPFGSSLDCGACAASPGRHNARMLAKLANENEVRQLLLEQHNIRIPKDTLFIGAEHNTTTDEIVLFDSNVTQEHHEGLKKLKSNLEKAQLTATKERLGLDNNSIIQAHINASNWGETRPEWGLAKNASFVIAPRKITKEKNLDGRCFLHSYDWNMDSEGTALEAIMQGPMVVTQWINNHYYFATVDNEKFGGGSKTTHNVTGKFGVVQGNGGDLKTGLPWESLFDKTEEPYHLPLRLSVVVHAPKSRVEKILDNNTSLKSLITNKWLHLIIMDPEDQTETLWEPADNKIKTDQSEKNRKHEKSEAIMA